MVKEANLQSPIKESANKKKRNEGKSVHLKKKRPKSNNNLRKKKLT